MVHRIIKFERRITREEADTSRILVRRELIRHFAGMRGELRVLLRDAVYSARLVSDLCSCGGLGREHSHHFLLLCGAGGLRAGERLTVQVEAGGC